MAFHIERLQELMMREIANFLQHDDAVWHAHTLVTVSRIEMDKNAQRAKIFVRIFPATDGEKILLHLRDIAPDIRFALSRRIYLKSIPRLYFVLEMETEGQM